MRPISATLQNYWRHVQCLLLLVEAVHLPQQTVAAAAGPLHQLAFAAVSLTVFQQKLTLSSGYQQ